MPVIKNREHRELTIRVQLVAALLLSTTVFYASPAQAAGFPPRTGFSKVVVGHLLAQPNASAPAQLITEQGGDIVDDYASATVGYIPSARMSKLIEIATLLGAEVSVRDDYDEIFLPGGMIDTRLGVERSNPGKHLAPDYPEQQVGVYVVQFAGPIKKSWLQAIGANDATLVQYLRYNAFIIAATPKNSRTIARLPFVQFVDVLHPFLKPQAVSRAAGESTAIYIQLANAPGVDDAVNELSIWSRTSTERSNGDDEVTLRGTFDGVDIDMIVSHPLVFGVAPVPRASFSDERLAMSLTRNINTAGAPVQPTKYKEWLQEVCPSCLALQADGFWIGFADTGIDGGVCEGATHHPALAKERIRFGASFDDSGYETNCASPPAVADTRTRNDPYGHGTAVAGTAAADPSISTDTDAGGFFLGVGIAPSAGIYMTKTVPSLQSLFPKTALLATDARIGTGPPVFIQNHSYNQYEPPPATRNCGDPTLTLYDGTYSVMSRNFDRAVRDADNVHTDDPSTITPITITVSAGNKHQQDPKYASCTDRLLALPPATAKNVISVGGAESVRPSNEQWQCDAGWPPTRADSFNNIEGDSKRGTMNPAWYKPDLMAPVSLIFVPTATTVGSMSDPCPSAPDAPPYWSSVGTSYAAPAAAAAALLASRVYADVVLPGCTTNCNPGAASPALLKAMLIMSARSMRGGEDRAAAPPWQAGHAYAANELALPTHGNGHMYRASQGTSGATEPNWPLSGSITDAGVTWTEAGSTIIGNLPNNQQGFGRLHLEDLLNAYPARDYVNENSAISPLDPWSKTYRVHDAGLPVKVVLTWTDPPQLEDQVDNSTATSTNPLINNLNLAVDLGSPCAARYIGNRTTVIDESHGEESAAALCTDVNYDSINNVEFVKFFPSSSDPQFTVRVTAADGTTNQNFALAVYNAYGATGTPPPTAPSGFTATGTGNGSVALSWIAVSGATTYEIQRKSGGFFTTIATQAATTCTDDHAVAGRGYLYRVRSRNSTGVSAPAVDFATTIDFTDPTLVPGTTEVRAQHFGELQTAINLVRAAVGIQAFTFTDSPLTPGTSIQATDINELRAALTDALEAAEISQTYTDSITPEMTTVRAVHIQELRNAVQ